MAHTAEPRALKYPKKAVARRVEGTVLLRVGIGPKGAVTNVSTISGDPILAESSIRKVRKWRFFPATRDGSPVDDQAEIQFGFRLKGNQIRAEVLGDFPFVPKSTY
jgi:periplasmic protein TonB